MNKSRESVLDKVNGLCKNKNDNFLFCPVNNHEFLHNIIADHSDSVMKKFTVNNRTDAHPRIINSSVCPLIENEN